MSLETRVKINKQGVNSIEKKMQEYNSRVLSAAAGLVADEMEAEALSAIADFYSSYSPVSYKRTEQFLSGNFFKRYTKNSSWKYHYGGIRLSSSALGGYKSMSGQDVTEIVYNLVVFNGEHGRPQNFGAKSIPATAPPVIERLYMKALEIQKDSDIYISQAVGMVNFE